MYVRMITNPKWIGTNIKTIIPVIVFLWGVFAYTMGWFNGVNAAVTNYPKLDSRLTIVELENKEFKASFLTFMEMYKLQVLGHNKEAQDLARTLPTNKP